MSYWYCNDCKRELCPENVTFEEKCDTCGHNAIWIEKEDDYYRITDDGGTLFKLDPGQENMDLLEEAMDIVIGAGFEFDEETLEIYQVVDQDDIPATLNDLTQLQVALTYLAS